MTAVNATDASDVLSQYQLKQQNGGQGTSELGRNEFMELMLAQLKNQNPLEPQDNGEFISQLAQFSSLEEMQNLLQETERLRLMHHQRHEEWLLHRINLRMARERFASWQRWWRKHRRVWMAYHRLVDRKLRAVMRVWCGIAVSSGEGIALQQLSLDMLAKEPGSWRRAAMGAGIWTLWTL